MCAFSITANCWKPHSSDPYIRIGRIWASYIKKYISRYISESPQIFEYLAGSDLCLNGQITNSLCQRQFGGKIQPQVLIAIYNLYLLITIAARKPPFLNTIILVLLILTVIEKITSKVFQNINLPLQTRHTVRGKQNIVSK